MSADLPHVEPPPSSDTAEHVTEARMRARTMLSSEAHVGAVDDWRRVLVSARDALVLLWLTWAALQGFGYPTFSADMLTALAVAIALFFGISTGRATRLQVQYFSDELERERTEIRENFEHEQEEVRELYAAKGFREPLLGQIVETLTADDDRLLKVMMEEELGLFVHHVTHPLLVGVWNFFGALFVGLAMALPILRFTESASRIWIPCAGTAMLCAISIIAARAARRSFVEYLAAGVMMAGVTGGVAFFLAQWLTGWQPPSPTP